MKTVRESQFEKMEVEDTIDLRAIISMLRRRLKIILLSVAIIMSVAFIYLAQTTPLYTSRALVLVDTAQKNLLQPGSEGAQNASLASSIIESEVELLRSDTVLLELVSASGLMQDAEFGPSLSLTDKVRQAVGMGVTERSGEALLNATLSKLRTAVTVRRRGLTNLIEVSITSANPQRAADLANTLVEVYIDLQVAAKSEGYLSATSVLSRQMDTAEAALARSDQALADFIDTNIDALERESGSASVARLRQRLEDLNTSRLEAQTQVEASTIALERQDWSTLAAQLEAEGLSALETQRQALARRLGEVEDGSAVAVNLRLSLDNLERQLEQQGRLAVASLQEETQSFQRDAEDVRENIRRELLGGELSAETLSRIYGLQQEASIAQRQYNNLLNRIRELETQAMVQIADSRMASAAIAPNRKSFPNTRLVLAAAFVVSLGLGVGLAFLSEFYFGGVNSSTQLANVTGARVGAVVPRISQSGDQLSVADIIAEAPMSQFPEAMRRLRANIERFSPEPKRGVPVIMVTSAVPAEGKSVLALSLARTFAAAGKRTLLIDADMRKPSMHKLTGVELSSGLYEFLVSGQENESAADCYDFDPRSDVGIIFGRERSGQPTDQLVQSEAFRAVIEDGCKRFDVVIIDTPPLIPVVDARYIAMQSDCAIFCVRAGETSQSDVRFAHEQLVDYISEEAAVLAVLNFHVGQESDTRYSGYYY
ncbi:GumC family protein [Roseinatronobacter sp. NSM]|uniref:GumC family protein n=1 Tax=Roseinatronobacter sp. NSM TaxID=3457785 RepID=UPI0040365C29